MIGGKSKMTRMRTTQCWEIMKCVKAEDCVAWKNPETPCWKIASELKNYQKKFNICDDCIVFLSQQGNKISSDLDISAILEKKAAKPVMQKCPVGCIST